MKNEGYTGLSDDGILSEKVCGQGLGFSADSTNTSQK